VDCDTSIPRRLIGVLVHTCSSYRIGQPCVRLLLLEQYEPDRERDRDRRNRGDRAGIMRQRSTHARRSTGAAETTGRAKRDQERAAVPRYVNYTTRLSRRGS
jgi:hypothetical protein